jgi:hypothetical protein
MDHSSQKVFLTCLEPLLGDDRALWGCYRLTHISPSLHAEALPHATVFGKSH